MTYTWCKSKNKVSRRIKNSKGPEIKICLSVHFCSYCLTVFLHPLPKVQCLVLCLVSCVSSHKSCVICQMSHVNFFFDKVVKLAGGGFVINGGTFLVFVLPFKSVLLSTMVKRYSVSFFIYCFFVTKWQFYYMVWVKILIYK